MRYGQHRPVEFVVEADAHNVAREPDILSKNYGIARQRHLRIYEISISYFGRTYAEGKKIDWKDGLKALWYIFKFRFR